MGDRGQVLIKDNGVYLYTHWGAQGLVDEVREAIRKHWRWDDRDYLTRIIFDTMTDKCHGEETGYGIGTRQMGDIWRLVTVDCESEIIIVQDHGTITETIKFEDA